MPPRSEPKLQDPRPAADPVAAEHAPPANEPSRPSRRRRLIQAAAAAAAVGALALGVHAFLTRGDEGTDDAQVEADVTPLAARVGGPIAQVLVPDDAPVKAGQPIALVDDADYQASARRAEAEAETARAQAAAADAQVQVVAASARGGFSGAQATVEASNAAAIGAAAGVDAARASLQRAQAEAARAASDFERARQLVQAQAISQQQFDAAQAGNDTAQAGLAAARAQLSAAEEARRSAEGRAAEAVGRLGASRPVAAQIAAAEAGAALAHARVKSAEAALDLARLQLSYTVVRAPSDGTVSRLQARVGQIVQPGQVLAELVPDRTYLVANFKETQIGGIRVGDAADVTVDAYPGKTLRGVVESISGGTGARFALLPPDNASGNFVKVVERVPVRIAWKDAPSDLPLRAGLSAYATVHTR
ncbi:MAG TPA: HlyD family secretion protein [Anaeromyxobacteraceae bacterium]|nr:HlyD family secretion protein [Anaeromyxobacteraceae bacterium]